jgi:hypothetical protein
MDSNQQNDLGNPKPDIESLKNDVSALTDTAKAKIGDIAEPVKDKAMEVAAQQKDAGADHLKIVARAVHGAASELESDMPQIAGYIRDAGQRLEQAASELRDGNVNDLMNSFGEYARNQPAIVFGGAMVAGFALTRFLKSSAHHTQIPNPGQGGTA